MITVGTGLADIMADDPLLFATGPFVERFIHHQKTHPVAKIEKLRRRGIVAAANRIATGLLKHSAAFARLGSARRPPAPGIVVQANAFELHAPAVDRESFVGIELEATNAKRRRVLIDDRPGLSHLRQDAVHARVFGRPSGDATFKATTKTPSGHRRIWNRSLPAGDDFTRRVSNLRHKPNVDSPNDIVLHDRPHIDIRRFLRDVRSGNERPIGIDVRLVQNVQVHIAIDSRTGVPARIGILLVVRDGDHVFAPA